MNTDVGLEQLLAVEFDTVRDADPACDAGPGKALGRRRNRTREVVHRAAAAGARVKTRRCAEQRMFVCHERARRQPEASQIFHREIWPELRHRPAGRHNKRAVPVDQVLAYDANTLNRVVAFSSILSSEGKASGNLVVDWLEMVSSCIAKPGTEILVQTLTALKSTMGTLCSSCLRQLTRRELLIFLPRVTKAL